MKVTGAMKVSRALLALSVLSLCLSLSACIDRTSGSGPYSTALTRLRELGVPDRFSDELLVSLAAEACAMPAGTRAAEFEPGAFRQLAAFGQQIDAGAAALVTLLYVGGTGLCAERDVASPTSAGGDLTQYAALEQGYESDLATLRASDWIGLTQLVEPTFSVPAPGVMSIDGGAPVGVDPGQAACFAVFNLGAVYAILLGPLDRALLTGDPDPVVQIVVDGGTVVLDSAPGGLSNLTVGCFGSD